MAIVGYEDWDVKPVNRIDSKYCKNVITEDLGLKNGISTHQEKCTDREWQYYPYVVGKKIQEHPLSFSFLLLGLFLCVILLVALKRYRKRKQMKESIIQS